MLAQRRLTPAIPTMPPTANDYHVAIVGYGPSGAIAANMLGAMGVRTLVIDRQLEVYDKPRAIAIDHEIVRTLDNFGLLDRMRPHIAPFAVSQHFGSAYQLIRTISMVPEPYPLGYTPTMVFSQPPFEAALRAEVARLPSVDVELGATLIGIEQSEQAVTMAFTASDGARHAITADYLIGCDGASSTVRQLVGIELEDLDFDEPWVVVDMLVKPGQGLRLPETSANFCDPVRPIVYVSGPGSHKRWEIMLQADEDPREMQKPEKVWQLLERWIAPDEADLWRAASYRFHALVADQWRRDRVFVAGDAAHQQPPILGQGMCQGVRDVANLVWKLERVLKGQSDPRLLDSYSQERRTHARELILRIKQMGSVLCERDPAAARERDARLLAEGGGVPPTITRQSVIPGIVEGLVADTGPGTGMLFPQPWTASPVGRVLMDKVHGRGWRLFVAKDAELPPGLIEHCGRAGIHVAQICDSLDAPLAPGLHPLVEQEHVLRDWMENHHCRYALVRPDHYVYAVAASGNDLMAVLDRLDDQLAPMGHQHMAGETL